MSRIGIDRATMTLALTTALAVVACAPRSSGPAVPSAETAASGTTASATTRATVAMPGSTTSDSLAIIAAANAFSAAYVRGDADSMAALYTEDAAIFPEGSAAIVGKEPIRRYWTLAPNRRITRHVLMPDRIEILGGVAHDYGRFQIAGDTDGTPWGPSFGKYVVVWRRGVDGQWRMYLDMWNRGPQAGN